MKMKRIILLLVLLVFALMAVVVLLINARREVIVMRIASFPMSRAEYSLYHEIRLNVRSGQARMVSFEGRRRPLVVLEHENIESRRSLLERTSRRESIALAESEFENLMKLAQALENSNHEYVEFIAFGSGMWRFIVIYNDVEYRLDRFADGDFDEMKALIEKIIDLSPIEMHRTFGPVTFPG